MKKNLPTMMAVILSCSMALALAGPVYANDIVAIEETEITEASDYTVTESAEEAVREEYGEESGEETIELISAEEDVTEENLFADVSDEKTEVEAEEQQDNAEFILTEAEEQQDKAESILTEAEDDEVQLASISDDDWDTESYESGVEIIKYKGKELYLVYRVDFSKVRSEDEEGNICLIDVDDSAYRYMKFSDVVVYSDGTVYVDLLDYEVPYYDDLWGGYDGKVSFDAEDGHTYIGYKSLDMFYNQEIASQLSKWNVETNIKE